MNCHLILGDFCTYDFKNSKFDLIFAASTLYWLDEKITFERANRLLNGGGSFVIISNITDEAARNSKKFLKDKQKVYEKYFCSDDRFYRKINIFNISHYGFSNVEISNFYYDVDMNAEDFVNLTMTYANHIMLQEPNRTKLMNGLKNAVKNNGGVYKRRDCVKVFKTIKNEDI